MQNMSWLLPENIRKVEEQALLVSANPKLIEIDNNWGVATESVFDFFKPRRHHSNLN
jgi:hypothetical protein